MHKFKLFCLGSLLFFTGCNNCFLTVWREDIDRMHLASSHVSTPDYRQANPPVGQKLITYWKISSDQLKEKPHIQLRVICWDYTEKVIDYPIEKRLGSFTFSLMNEEYEKTGGMLTYKAEILGPDNNVLGCWEHQLWVNLIQLEEEAPQQETSEEAESSESAQ